MEKEKMTSSHWARGLEESCSTVLDSDSRSTSPGSQPQLIASASLSGVFFRARTTRRRDMAPEVTRTANIVTMQPGRRKSGGKAELVRQPLLGNLRVNILRASATAVENGEDNDNGNSDDGEDDDFAPVSEKRLRGFCEKVMRARQQDEKMRKDGLTLEKTDDCGGEKSVYDHRDAVSPESSGHRVPQDKERRPVKERSRGSDRDGEESNATTSTPRSCKFLTEINMSTIAESDSVIMPASSIDNSPPNRRETLTVKEIKNNDVTPHKAQENIGEKRNTMFRVLLENTGGNVMNPSSSFDGLPMLREHLAHHGMRIHPKPFNTPSPRRNLLGAIKSPPGNRRPKSKSLHMVMRTNQDYDSDDVVVVASSESTSTAKLNEDESAMPTFNRSQPNFKEGAQRIDKISLGEKIIVQLPIVVEREKPPSFFTDYLLTLSPLEKKESVKHNVVGFSPRRLKCELLS